MKLLLINTHSIVDVITNSSSEMFVCDTDKSLEFIRITIQQLLNNAKETDEWENHNGYELDNCIGEVYSITEENINEFIQRYVIGWSCKIPGFKEAGIPYLIDWFEYDKAYTTQTGKAHKYPWNKHAEYNNKLQEEITAARKAYEKNWLVENIETIRNILIGQIVILSADDNSIPYTIFKEIEDLFNGRRFHLG